MTRSARCDRSESGASAYPGYVLRTVNAWLRRHPSQADGLLAAALLVFSVSQLTAAAPDPLERVGYVAVTVLLAATVALGAAQVAFGVRIGGTGRVFALQPNNADLAIPVLLYTLAAFRPRPVSITGLVICLLGAVAAITRWSPAHRANAGDAVLSAAIGLGGLTVAAWVLGDSVAYRYRRARFASLEERAARLEAERDAQARIAAAAERERELTQRRARVVDEAEARLRR